MFGQDYSYNNLVLLHLRTLKKIVPNFKNGRILVEEVFIDWPINFAVLLDY